MRAYYYFLFRIYEFYIHRMKEKNIPLFYVCSISTVLMFFNFYTVYTVLEFNDLIPSISSKLAIISITLALWIINFIFFVRPKKFLKYNFEKDGLGGLMIILYFVLTVTTFILVANKNRERIFTEREKVKTEIFKPSQQ